MAAFTITFADAVVSTHSLAFQDPVAMNLRGVLAELRRRSVVRVAVVYGAAAFAVLQAADILVPALHLPAWTLTFVVVLLALGFPIALALSWVLEVTPDGIRMTDSVTVASDAPQRSLLGRRTIAAAGVLVLAGIAFGAGWILGPDARPDSGLSVAVLPFADLSDDQSQEYFGDGIAEELLNTLRSSAVAVASRTSSFAYKGRNLSVREIADELGVNHIVDGSVRKAANRLRISAQVIDVRSDRQLWAQTFNRDSDDIFRIQEEIAQAVASALSVQLAGIATASGTRNAEAYDLYLLGLHYWNRRTPESLHRALDVFTEATKVDPGFARAWAGVGLAHFVLPEYTEYDADRAMTLARDAAERAVALDPSSAEARAVLAGILDRTGERAASLREYDRAIELDSTFATAHHWRAILLSGDGRLGEAEEALRRARRIDPASLPIQAFLALNLELQRRTAEALVESEAVRARAPDYRNALYMSFVYGAELGRAREFEPQLRDYLRSINEDTSGAAIIVNGIENPQARQRAIALVEAIVGRRTSQRRVGSGDLYYLVDLFALLEAREQALRLVETDPEWYLIVDRPLFDFVRDDPRFQAVVARRK